MCWDIWVVGMLICFVCHRIFRPITYVGWCESCICSPCHPMSLMLHFYASQVNSIGWYTVSLLSAASSSREKYHRVRSACLYRLATERILECPVAIARQTVSIDSHRASVLLSPIGRSNWLGLWPRSSWRRAILCWSLERRRCPGSAAEDVHSQQRAGNADEQALLVLTSERCRWESVNLSEFHPLVFLFVFHYLLCSFLLRVSRKYTIRPTKCNATCKKTNCYKHSDVSVVRDGRVYVFVHDITSLTGWRWCSNLFQ